MSVAVWRERRSVPGCGGRQLRLRERRTRKIKGITHGNVPMRLEVSVPKYRCLACGRTFMQAILGVRPYSRTSQPLKEELKAFLMTKGKSRKRLMKEGGIQTFNRLLALLETTGFDLFKTLGKPLKSWQTEIRRLFKLFQFEPVRVKYSVGGGGRVKDAAELIITR